MGLMLPRDGWCTGACGGTFYLKVHFFGWSQDIVVGNPYLIVHIYASGVLLVDVAAIEPGSEESIEPCDELRLCTRPLCDVPLSKKQQVPPQGRAVFVVARLGRDDACHRWQSQRPAPLRGSLVQHHLDTLLVELLRNMLTHLQHRLQVAL